MPHTAASAHSFGVQRRPDGVVAAPFGRVLEQSEALSAASLVLKARGQVVENRDVPDYLIPDVVEAVFELLAGDGRPVGPVSLTGLHLAERIKMRLPYAATNARQPRRTAAGSRPRSSRCR